MSGQSKFRTIFGNLIGEINKEGNWQVSLGRICWWVAFTPAVKIWVESAGAQDIAEGHLTLLLALAAYNLGKKFIPERKVE